MLDLYQREGQAAQERAEAGIVLAHEQGFAVWIAWGMLLRGCALAEQGQSTEGIGQMHQGIAAWQATGAEVFRPYSLGLLAEAYGKAGQAEEGLPLLAEALAAANNTGERYYEAELYRLKGAMLLTQADKEPRWLEAEESFRQALAVARHQQAKSLELRATMSLSRLWQRLGKRAEARQLLAEIYGWFTEGFDTADLQEAKALLAELS
jgi:predicted ATPase